MIRMYFSCIYLCIILVSNCNGEEVMEEVLGAVEKAIIFYSESYKDMNIDGIFGLRVLEGQFELMLNFLKSKSPLEAGLQKVYVRIDEAHRQAKKICDSSLNVLKESDKHYFASMNRVIRRPWSFARNYRRIDPTLKWKKSSNSSSVLSETFSDRCMNELMGGPTQPPCSISRECVTVMSTRGMDGYTITHQLLYTMLAEQSGCLETLNSELGRLPNQSLTVEKLQVEFCANNFFETSESVIMQKKVIRFDLQDLFLEQELVCTMLGYVEFLHIDWLKQITSWQMPPGCFGEKDLDKEKHSRRERRDSRTVVDNGVDVGQPTRVIHPAQPNEHLPVRPTLQGKPESIGNAGVLTGVKPLANVDMKPAGRISREKFVGLNSNARNSGYDDSKIPRGIAVMGMKPIDTELGQLGKHHIKLNRRGGFLEQAVGERNHEQGRVGDTRMRMEENTGNQGFESVGNIWKHLIPVTETGGGDNQPIVASDEDNFKINRQINRKLLYEKTLNDGCWAHKTAVAMGALSQYLRFLIFANSSGFDVTKHLTGINYLMNPDSVLPSSLPSASGLMKKIPLPFERNTVTSAVVKSSKSTKMYVWKDRLDSVRQRDMFIDRFKRRSTSGLQHLVITTALSVDDKDTDYDAVKNVDETKKGKKPEADVYDEDDANDVPMDTGRPVVKSNEDDLLLYQELVNVKPTVLAAGTEVANRLMAKASHMLSSQDSSVEGVSSISSTYAFVVVITAVILLVLYKSLRKHRIGIQHRHGRWK